MNAPLFMGIDGGGTRLRIAIVDADLNIIAQVSDSAANPNIIGHDAAQKHIQHSIGRALKQAGIMPLAINAVGIGIAGASHQHSRAWLVDTLEAPLPHSLLVPSSDLEIALVGALAQRHGILLLAGTGSAVFGIAPSGQTRQVGGWGYLLGDEGGSYWIGLQALRQVIQDADFGGVRPDSFSHNVLGELGLAQPRELIAWLYRQPETVVRAAAVARIVLRQAQCEDEDAIAILQAAANQLVRRLQFLRRQPGYEQLPIAFAGGLLDHSSWLSEELARRLKLKHRPAAKYPPAIGAALLAKMEWNEPK